MDACFPLLYVQKNSLINLFEKGVFQQQPLPKKYVKPRLGESTLM